MYIYDLPAEFNTRMHQYRLDKVCSSILMHSMQLLSAVGCICHARDVALTCSEILRRVHLALCLLGLVA